VLANHSQFYIIIASTNLGTVTSLDIVLIKNVSTANCL